MIVFQLDEILESSQQTSHPFWAFFCPRKLPCELSFRSHTFLGGFIFVLYGFPVLITEVELKLAIDRSPCFLQLVSWCRLEKMMKLNKPGKHSMHRCSQPLESSDVWKLLWSILALELYPVHHQIPAHCFHMMNLQKSWNLEREERKVNIKATFSSVNYKSRVKRTNRGSYYLLMFISTS